MIGDHYDGRNSDVVFVFDGVKGMPYHILHVEIVTDLFRDMKVRM